MKRDLAGEISQGILKMKLGFPYYLIVKCREGEIEREIIRPKGIKTWET